MTLAQMLEQWDPIARVTGLRIREDRDANARDHRPFAYYLVCDATGVVHASGLTLLQAFYLGRAIGLKMIEDTGLATNTGARVPR